jgi:hypothetical protein
MFNYSSRKLSFIYTYDYFIEIDEHENCDDVSLLEESSELTAEQKISSYLDFIIFRRFYAFDKTVRQAVYAGDVDALALCFEWSSDFFDGFVKELNERSRWLDYAEFFLEYASEVKESGTDVIEWQTVNVRLVHSLLKKLQDADIDIGASGAMSLNDMHKYALATYVKFFHPDFDNYKKKAKSVKLKLCLFLVTLICVYALAYAYYNNLLWGINEM